MDCRGVVLAQALGDAVRAELADVGRLLDVGGGSGVYSCGIVHACEQLSATVLEKSPVDVIARKAVENRGFADRVTVETGDMFATWPGGYDAHLLSNVIHDWTFQRSRSCL